MNYVLGVAACVAAIVAVVYLASYASAGPLVDELSIDELLGSEDEDVVDRGPVRG